MDGWAWGSAAWEPCGREPMGTVRALAVLSGRSLGDSPRIPLSAASGIEFLTR